MRPEMFEGRESDLDRFFYFQFVSQSVNESLLHPSVQEEVYHEKSNLKTKKKNRIRKKMTVS